MPACKEIIAWVRHTAGQVTFSASGQAMTAVDIRETMDVQGVACTETMFSLTGGVTAGNHTFQLGLTLESGDSSALILDYGAVLL